MPQVARAVVKERAKRLRDKGAAALVRHLDGEVGKRRRVLMELNNVGRTEQFTPVQVAADRRARWSTSRSPATTVGSCSPLRSSWRKRGSRSRLDGRRSAYARFAHLVCEFATRMHAVGLMESSVCAMPFTQADIADALGLSNVHVSRVLGRLRKQGLFTWQDGILTIKAWKRLQKAAEFDPSYLQLDSIVGSDGLGSR